MSKATSALLVALFPFVLLALVAAYVTPIPFTLAIYQNTQTAALTLGIAWFVATDCAFLYSRMQLLEARSQGFFPSPQALRPQFKSAQTSPTADKNRSNAEQVGEAPALRSLLSVLNRAVATVWIMQLAHVLIVLFVLVVGLSAAPSEIPLTVICIVCLALSGTNALIFLMGPLRLCVEQRLFEAPELPLHLFVQVLPLIGAVDLLNVRARLRKCLD